MFKPITDLSILNIGAPIRISELSTLNKLKFINNLLLLTVINYQFQLPIDITNWNQSWPIDRPTSHGSAAGAQAQEGSHSNFARGRFAQLRISWGFSSHRQP